jgi:hypothetical protein
MKNAYQLQRTHCTTHADQNARVIGRGCDSLNRLGFGALAAANNPKASVFWGQRYLRHKVLIKLLASCGLFRQETRFPQLPRLMHGSPETLSSVMSQTNQNKLKSQNKDQTAVSFSYACGRPCIERLQGLTNWI